MANREFARGLRRNMTDAEHRLWYHLRARRFGGFRFRRQHPVGPYVVDFECFRAGLVVEVDGGQHGDDQARDAARTRYLKACGYRVIRFWNHEVLAQTDAVLERLWRELVGDGCE